MSLPRQILPNQFYMLTRRCVQRMFLLLPDRKTTEAFWYCLAEAAQRFEIEVILPCAMSNHHHTVFYDRHGRIVEFTHRFHEMLAKCLNARFRRRENFWSSEEPGFLRLVEREDVMRRLVYTATNPVKDNLVETVQDWPGANGLQALLDQRPVVTRRPDFFFRRDGVMPETVTLELVIPPELGDRDEILRELRERVAEAEARYAAERRRTGRRVLGRRGVLRQKITSVPAQPQLFHPAMRPKFAARSIWSCLEALQRNASFLRAYRKARQHLLAGVPIPFPIGTYYLRRFAGVAIVQPQLVAS